MASTKLEIQWSPVHANKFITWGTEICLYEVESQKNTNKPSITLSETTIAHLLATNSNYHYVRCIDISPKQNSDILLAVGQANGRVSLSTFGASEYDNNGLAGKELVPRHARQCNTVAWNPIETNILAVGLDKYRTDYSVLLWDINKCTMSVENSLTNRFNDNLSIVHQNALAAVELPKPVAEFGVSETTNSLAWFITQPRTIVLGLNQKSIKIIDLRDVNKVVNSTQTKSVYGLSVHPHNDRHIASFVDNFITVWDTRNFEKPILTLTHNKPILKMHWCSTRPNLLASLQKDSSVLNLHNIQHTIVGNEEVEPSVLERTVVPGSPHNITSFSWHPYDENRLLTIALSGCITDYVVYERITLNWAPNSNMVWTHGRKILKCLNDKNEVYEVIEDVSHKIKERCLAGYGLHHEFWKNGDLSNNKMLLNIWNWLHLSRNLLEVGNLYFGSMKHPGVKLVLKLDSALSNGNISKADNSQSSWVELANMNCQGFSHINEERECALHLCGWIFTKDATLFTTFIDILEKEECFSRAAAIAVFNLKIRNAIDILKKAAEKSEDNHYTVVAMALAGYTEDKNSMWRQLCVSSKTQICDPYLRAMFAFLTAENNNYDCVLNENGMSVEDRIAFACVYLSDKKLHDYLNNFTNKLMEEGSLYALLLTGTTKEGLQVLQKYLDTTSDIQSTTLIAVKAFPADLIQEICVQEWIASYRNLLNSWRMWNHRAQFDIMLSSCNPSDKIPQQVYVSCNFCGKSVSAYLQGMNKGRGSFSRLNSSSNKMKMSSCPNCRKPLPRCAICLMHMGTSSEMPNGFDGDNKIIEFSMWFTWCQSCRHGGHSVHIMNWFKEHSECPVTSCNCKCFFVDTVSNSTLTNY